ncbi:MULTISPECIES: HlyD family secretion protein [unclassified Cupriavidus]|uniref:HlyD family secretion protein n=1 Tax=unclassified Cupriavidus TaxID=2640874 RepID=UPI0010F6A87D|nr:MULTISPECIES: HlyD family secretion protein [unclassified Cupriavidus]MWL90543.1 HlyD family efflux transporter periplasmic adaptor subunit [Cupriavidus sp. SW-Y-13]
MTVPRHSPRIFYALIGAAAVTCALYAGFRIFDAGRQQRTDDAYIRADSVYVSPRVTGQITEVLVQDNQRVKAGQLVARIDAADYLAAKAEATANVAVARADIKNLEAGIARQRALVEQARASVRASEASLRFTELNAQRYRNLSSSGAGTQQEWQRADADLSAARANRDRDVASGEAASRTLMVLTAQLEAAQAQLQRHEATLQKAVLNVSYTHIVAPFDGMVGQRSARVGAYVSAGTPLMAIVPLDDIYVVANFRETQLARMKPHQSVTIQVDGNPEKSFRGHLDSVAPATGLSFSPVAPDNATGNFTKVVQRVPVKIRFDEPGVDADLLRVGMSVVVSVKTKDGV